MIFLSNNLLNNKLLGQWEILIKQATDCFTKQLKKAASKPRNLILDQTNVYAVARERKVAQYRQRGYKVNPLLSK